MAERGGIILYPLPPTHNQHVRPHQEPHQLAASSEHSASAHQVAIILTGLIVNTQPAALPLFSRFSSRFPCHPPAPSEPRACCGCQLVNKLPGAVNGC